jgi:hypothetical protein
VRCRSSRHAANKDAAPDVENSHVCNAHLTRINQLFLKSESVACSGADHENVGKAEIACAHECFVRKCKIREKSDGGNVTDEM